ncbi:hypothetical protein GTR02_08295 [Kineococcus sp. R8]|uniref:hypothetical protein n=1 Tax=Kineococcus siccus TaxID=2696567 RepID=UPI001412E888|nr:hypothetical protein [Kineococcus siccus]NAZ81819.1 hypothetical protein [Kineococcus siccus]
MDDTVDQPYLDAVRVALDAFLAGVRAEADGDAWAHLEHRALAHRVLGLVAGACAPTTDPAVLLRPAERLVAHLRALQGPSGLFTGGDNVDSPPDSAFSVNDLADAAALLRSPSAPGAPALAAALDEVLAAATPALLRGGVHTPNHRWELSAALARLHRVRPDPALVARVEQWLAEGVDIDGDGLFSERSANYAAHVSNPSLLAIADVLGRDDLVDAVERNLTATLDLLLPDGTVETVHSRRQDQRGTIRLGAYLLPLRRVARARGRGDLAWAAELALAQGVEQPARAAAQLVLDPDAAAALPPAEAPAPRRRRVLAAAGVVLDHGPRGTTVVFGGSDHARHGRVRSGLATNPTFLRLLTPSLALDGVRLSRTFFGLGPFRADTSAVREDGVHLHEEVGAAYYQPLAAGLRDPAGAYAVEDEGRFSAAMSFGARERDVVRLTTDVDVRLVDGGAELTLDTTGPAVDAVLELALRPGGSMTGARADGEHRWRLDPAAGPGAAAAYRQGEQVLHVRVLAAEDAGGGPVAAPRRAPGYHPGEDYAFLGGTDAAQGELLLVAFRTPCHLRVGLSVEAVHP